MEVFGRCGCLLIGLCLFSMTTAGIMGDECDWSGSGLTNGDATSRGVTPVYLRCSSGKVTWRYPRGALRVVLRHQTSRKEFRACVKIHNRPKPNKTEDTDDYEYDYSRNNIVNSDQSKMKYFPARLFLEGPRSLLHLYSNDDDSPRIVRCFRSKHGQAAIYVEAEDYTTHPYERRAAVFEYDLQVLVHGGDAESGDGSWEACRPCSEKEMAHTYCTSDIVTRGLILGVQNREELGTSQLTIKVSKLIRDNSHGENLVRIPTGHNADILEVYDVFNNDVSNDSNAYQIIEQMEVTTRPRPAKKHQHKKHVQTKRVQNKNRHVRLHVPAHCGISTGTGEFVFMGRKRLGKLGLICAPRLEEWVTVVNKMNKEGAAHCVLGS